MTALLIVGVALLAFTVGFVVGRRRDRVESRPATAVGANTPSTDYRDVLGRQTLGIVVSSATAGHEYRNEAAERLAGTHVGALVDGAIDDHLAGARDGRPSEETLDLFGPPRRVIHITAEPLPAGRAVAFVADITEQRRSDEVRRDFVANVSHELRTPVGALMLLAETLVGADDHDVVERVAERMLGEAERAARTIDDLLVLSRIESATELDSQPVSLADVVRDAVGRAAELAAGAGISISTLDPVDAGVPRAERAVVDGDRALLVSAVGNLVENAVKYSARGDTVQIRVSTDDAFGEVAVVDHGPGIPKQDLDRIFERFYRVDRARSRDTGGTGLGLSIVRHVAQRHGGSVAVESTEGEGATFRLQLPLADPTDASQPAGRVVEGDDRGEGVVA